MQDALLFLNKKTKVLNIWNCGILQKTVYTEYKSVRKHPFYLVNMFVLYIFLSKCQCKYISISIFPRGKGKNVEKCENVLTGIRGKRGSDVSSVIRFFLQGRSSSNLAMDVRYWIVVESINYLKSPPVIGCNLVLGLTYKSPFLPTDTARPIPVFSSYFQ